MSYGHRAIEGRFAASGADESEVVEGARGFGRPNESGEGIADDGCHGSLFFEGAAPQGVVDAFVQLNLQTFHG